MHTINNSGKKIIGAEGYTTVNAKEFRKLCSQLTQFKGYARENPTAIFCEAPKTSGEIRLSEKFEQFWKINVHGVMKTVDEVVPFCVRQKGYEVTENKMILDYKRGKNKGKLGMVIIEMCYMSVSLKVFCKSCYMLEEYTPLALRRSNAFNRIE